MSNQAGNPELEEFAEWVRKQSIKLVALCMSDHPRSREKAKEIACSLCAEAAGVKNRSQMAAEVAAGNYDLSALPAPSGGMEPG